MGSRGLCPATDEPVSLREVNRGNLYVVLDLQALASPDGRRFLASNSHTLAEAHFHDAALHRAIYSGQIPVGFLMIYDANLSD